MDFLFGPPDIGKLKNRRNIKGLIAALNHRDADTRKGAAEALAELAENKPGEEFAPAVDALIAAFDDTTAGMLSAAVRALGAIGQPAALPLISALRSSNPRAREGACRAVGRLPHIAIDPAYLRLAVDPLVGLLSDPRDSIRLSAAITLARLGPQLDKAQRSLPVQALILSLKDSAVDVREAAGSALGQMGDARAIPPLIAAMEDTSSAVRRVASGALETLGWQPSTLTETGWYQVARQEWDQAIETGAGAIPALIRVLEGSDAGACAAALHTLGQISYPDVIPPLVANLKHPDELVRAAAANALQVTRAPEAITPLLKAVHDRDRLVRMAVAGALGHTGDPRAASALTSMLRTHETEMSSAVGDALVNLGAVAVPDLIHALAETDGLYGELIPPLLARIGAPAITPLVEMLRDLLPPANQLAAFTLGEIHDPIALWPLVAALRDPEIAPCAAEALGKIADPRAARPLIEMLGALAPPAQLSAAIALGQICEPLAVEPLIQLLLQSNEREVRAAAAEALLKIDRSRRLDISLKRQVLEQKERISAAIMALPKRRTPSKPENPNSA